MLAVLVGVELVTALQINGVYGGAAVVAGIYAGRRHTTWVAALTVVASAGSGLWSDNLGTAGWAVRFAACVLLAAVAVVTASVNARRRERLTRTTEMAQRVLDALAVELTGARTVKDVAEGFVGHAVGALGATSAMYLSLDADDVLRSVSWQGRSEGGADHYQELALHSSVPGAVAARERTDVHYRSLAEIERAFPDLAGYYPDDRSLHVLPLYRGEVTYGVLAMTFPAGAFTAAEDNFLHSVAGALTGAVIRAGELQESEAATQRTALLAEASMTMSRSLDMDDTLLEVGRLLVPRFADWCSVQLMRDGVLETISVQHRDEETTRWAEGMRDAFPTDMDSPTGAPHVVRTGQSEVYPFIPAEMLDAAAHDEEHLEILKRLGFTSAVVAPLRARDGVLGVVTLIHAESGRRYSEPDLAFVEKIADRVALALEAAVTFEEQAERLADVTLVAEAAQLAILTPPPPRVGPYVLSARYHSAASEAQVGGDLYEVVLGPSSLRLLVGDVRGKGLPAVRTATVVLGAFRAAAATTDDLPHVASEIDRRIVPYLLDAEEFVTGVFVDVQDDGRYTVVSCGHPPPLLLSAQGRVESLVLDHAPPLGLGAGGRPVMTTGRLTPGDRLLLHTDGLVEARDLGGVFVDPATFLVDACTAPVAVVLDQLLEQVTLAAGQRLDDDLALLMIGYEP